MVIDTRLHSLTNGSISVWHITQIMKLFHNSTVLHVTLIRKLFRNSTLWHITLIRKLFHIRQCRFQNFSLVSMDSFDKFTPIRYASQHWCFHDFLWKKDKMAMCVYCSNPLDLLWFTVYYHGMISKYSAWIKKGHKDWIVIKMFVITGSSNVSTIILFYL